MAESRNVATIHQHKITGDTYGKQRRYRRYRKRFGPSEDQTHRLGGPSARFSPVFPLIRRPVGANAGHRSFQPLLRPLSPQVRRRRARFGKGLEIGPGDHRSGIQGRSGGFGKGPGQRGRCWRWPNHPFGGVEGVVMGAMLLEARKDVKILGNYLLKKMDGLADRIIPWILSADPMPSRPT